MPTPYTAIISADEFTELRAHGSPVIFDTRFKLDDTEYGQRAYRESHISGAFYLHLDRDLSSPIAPGTGRHPLPVVEAFAQNMRRHGVSSDTQVIVYDDAGGMFAARCWWLLKWLGNDAVAVLDGGYPAWLKGNGACDAQTPSWPTPGNFQPRVRTELVLSAQEVTAALTAGTIRLCDARAPERYRGDVEPIDKVAGHVPGALNVPFAHNLNEDKRFKSPEHLRAIYAGLNSEVVHMCGSGVTACHNLLASVVAGLPMPKLYAGSWSEWITDPSRPVTRG